jgi:hypothetical protein
MRQKTRAVIGRGNRPMRQETSPVIGRSNRSVGEQQTRAVVGRGNRSVCRFERIEAAPIAKQCNTQKKRTTNKFFHDTLLFNAGNLLPWYLS